MGTAVNVCGDGYVQAWDDGWDGLQRSPAISGTLAAANWLDLACGSAVVVPCACFMPAAEDRLASHPELAAPAIRERDMRLRPQLDWYTRRNA